MVTFAQLRDAEPHRLTDAAEVWERHGKAAGRRAEEVRTEVLDLVRGWSGPAARTAAAKLTELAEELSEAHTAMRRVSDILAQAGTAIAGARADLASAVEYARGKGLTVEEDGSVSWLDWNPLEWGEDRAAAEHAARLIEDALRRATEADADAAADLRVARLVGRDEASAAALTLSDDPAVERAAERVRELMRRSAEFDLGGNRDELREIAQIIDDLAPAEREAFLAQLSDEELRALRGRLRGMSDVLWHDNGLPPWERLDLDTSLLSGLSPEGVDRLVGVWPDLQPTPPDGTHYERPGGPLDDGDRSWRDVNQGGVGDCWALAVLAGEGHGDAGAYRDMVRQNPNGTVSVRLYDDGGDPHWVTVTGDLPVNDGNLAGVSGDNERAAGTAENWPAYVEKALARSYEDGDPSTSGYENIDGDWPDQSIEILTGRDAHNVDASEADVEDIRRRVESGQVVTVATQGGDDSHYIHSNDSGNLVGRHAYFVKEVLPDGRVVLGNPWGPDHPDGEVTLSEEEVREYGTKVTVEG